MRRAWRSLGSYVIHIIGNIPPLRGATPTQTGNRYPRQVVGHDDIIGPVERDTVVRAGRPMVLVRVRLPEADETKINNMERSDSIKEIANALCEFQKKVGKIKKDSNNPFFKSKYASLANILDVIQSPLSECGLSITQMPTGENELETILMHISGEYISSTYSMRPSKNDPQGVGSCITYQRRYAIGAILCLNIDDDDDANIASGNTAQKEQPKKANSNDKKELTRDHINNESAMESISKWIYKNEKKAKESNQPFSVESLINKSYIVGKVEMESIIEIYNNYKINNNLS